MCVCVNILYMRTMCKYCICQIINSTYVNIPYMDYSFVGFSVTHGTKIVNWFYFATVLPKSGCNFIQL